MASASQTNEDRMAWARAHPERVAVIRRRNHLRRMYGMTEQQYDEMLSSQLSRCAICGTDQCGTGRRFAVDHNHKTGEIRGLLCRSCNGFLGTLEKHLDGFLAYLYLSGMIDSLPEVTN